MRIRRHARLVVTNAVLAALVLVPLAAVPVLAGDPAHAKHDRIVAYWTPERLANAAPRDFVRESNGSFQQIPRGKAQPTAPSGNNVTGGSWTLGGQILKTSGKVVFTMNSGDYICSGSVVTDTRSAYSIVLSAGHCAFDGADGGFARNWMFIPEFDSAPTYTCAQSKYGCWTASSLVIHSGFATSGSFNTQATVHDWSFAVVGAGGKTNAQLDTTVRSFPLSTSNLATGGQIFAFGYPAAGKYHGKDLTYCSDQVFTDASNQNLTWGIDCNMTGGSSGGPWLTSFDKTAGAGVLSSLNSYGYQGLARMFGPKFNANTQATFDAAQSATTGNMVVGS